MAMFRLQRATTRGDVPATESNNTWRCSGYREQQHVAMFRLQGATNSPDDLEKLLSGASAAIFAASASKTGDVWKVDRDGLANLATAAAKAARADQAAPAVSEKGETWRCSVYREANRGGVLAT